MAEHIQKQCDINRYVDLGLQNIVTGFRPCWQPCEIRGDCEFEAKTYFNFFTGAGYPTLQQLASVSRRRRRRQGHDRQLLVIPRPRLLPERRQGHRVQKSFRFAQNSEIPEIPPNEKPEEEK